MSRTICSATFEHVLVGHHGSRLSSHSTGTKSIRMLIAHRCSTTLGFEALPTDLVLNALRAPALAKYTFAKMLVHRHWKYQSAGLPKGTCERCLWTTCFCSPRLHVLRESRLLSHGQPLAFIVVKPAHEHSRKSDRVIETSSDEGTFPGLQSREQGLGLSHWSLHYMN